MLKEWLELLLAILVRNLGSLNISTQVITYSFHLHMVTSKI